MTESAIIERFFTAIEYIKMQLPGEPETKSGFIRKAKKIHWPKRPRKGRGGGWEYSTEPLSAEAKMALIKKSLKTGIPETPAIQKIKVKDYASLKSWQRADADNRLSIVKGWDDFSKDIPQGKLTEAATIYTKPLQISPRTLRNYITLYRNGGYYALAPQDYTAGRSETKITKEVAKFLERTYLVHLGPTIKETHERFCKAFPDIKISERAIRYYLNKKFTKSQQLLVRNKTAWNRLYSPYVRRDWQATALNEVWCADFYQCNYFCHHRGKVIRPWAVIIEEMKSRRIVGWLVVPSTGALAIGQALLYAISKFGTPETLYTDLGKDFTSKHVAGICEALGIEIFPARGRNPREKPVESCLGMFTNRANNAPGWCGYNHETKPANADAAAKSGKLSDRDGIQKLYDTMIIEKNARLHSGTGRIPDEDWKDFQPVIPSESCLYFLLMHVAEATVRDSTVLLNKLLYRSDDLLNICGERVTVRRDPLDYGRAAIFYKDKFFCVATLEIAGHYRGPLTRENINTTRRITKKASKLRDFLMDHESIIEDPVRAAMQLGEDEQPRPVDIKPVATGNVRTIFKNEKVMRETKKALDRKAAIGSKEEEYDPSAIGKRYLSAISNTAVKPHLVSDSFDHDEFLDY